MFENLRRGRQARNFTENDPKILDLKSSSEQIIFRNCRWVPLFDIILNRLLVDMSRDNHIMMASFRYIRENESIKTE